MVGMQSAFHRELEEQTRAKAHGLRQDLSGRPSHVPPSEQVKVHVKDRLPRVPVTVEDQPVPPFAVTPIFRHLGSSEE